RKNIEMVEPKVVHDLLQLPVAVDGTGHLGHSKFFNDSRRTLAVVSDGAWDCVGINAQSTALSGALRGDVAGWLLHGRRRVGTFTRVVAAARWDLHGIRGIVRGSSLRITGNHSGCGVGSRRGRWLFGHLLRLRIVGD